MSTTVVADRYTIPRINGKRDVSNKKLERPGMKVALDVVEFTNEGTAEHGELYIIDEKATEARYEQQEINAENRKKRELLEKASPQDIAKAMMETTKAIKQTPVAEGPTEEELRATCEELGIVVKHNWGTKKMTEEIAKAKA